MYELIMAAAGVAALAGIRQAIKSYRAKKSLVDIAVDAVEAAVDSIDDK